MTTHELSGECQFQVYYEDTDLSGFVYHANYLKFFERAREHLIGVDKIKMCAAEHGIHFVVSHMDIKYLLPARLGDKVTIRSDLEVSRSPVSRYLQEAFVGETKLVSAQIKVAALNQDNRPTRLPPEVLASLVSGSTV